MSSRVGIAGGRSGRTVRVGSTDRRSTVNRKAQTTMTATSAPIAALTFLGILVAVLGLFVGGSVELLLIGIATLVAAGLIGALGQRRI